MSIEWKGTRKDGKVSIGTSAVFGTPVEWFITKTAGGLYYELHFGEIKAVPRVTCATIKECKEYAEAYFV